MNVKKTIIITGLLLFTAIIFAACTGADGPMGPPGPRGPEGLEGPQGEQGPPGETLTEEQVQALEAATNLAGIQFPMVDEARRGCPACHVLLDEETGAYTLPFEAHERAEARGNEHPEVAPDGTSLAATEEVNVTVCLQCHAPGTGEREGKGVIAPLSLRDIVHPAHMYSQWFKLHYSGNCFACHNVNGNGEFELLTEKVDVNEKGVPNPDAIPIPGSIKLQEQTGDEEQGVGGESLEGSVAVGGRLYDKWWTEAGLDEPSTDSPIWARQDTNTRSGGDTWRCKECHGWDYLGANGAYGSGSHYTGFPGVFEAQEKTAGDLLAMFTGELDVEHDFSMLDEEAISSLVLFLKEGLFDVSEYINMETKSAIGGDVSNGAQLYATTCAACHGSDGQALNFGDEEEPEYVSTIAVDNPWEFIHKVRFGQPGSFMPAVYDLGWTLQSLLDLLAYSQTLP